MRISRDGVVDPTSRARPFSWSTELCSRLRSKSIQELDHIPKVERYVRLVWPKKSTHGLSHYPFKLSRGEHIPIDVLTHKIFGGCTLPAAAGGGKKILTEHMIVESKSITRVRYS